MPGSHEPSSKEDRNVIEDLIHNLSELCKNQRPPIDGNANKTVTGESRSMSEQQHQTDAIQRLVQQHSSANESSQNLYDSSTVVSSSAGNIKMSDNQDLDQATRERNLLASKLSEMVQKQGHPVDSSGSSNGIRNQTVAPALPAAMAAAFHGNHPAATAPSHALNHVNPTPSFMDTEYELGLRAAAAAHAAAQAQAVAAAAAEQHQGYLRAAYLYGQNVAPTNNTPPTIIQHHHLPKQHAAVATNTTTTAAADSYMQVVESEELFGYDVSALQACEDHSTLLHHPLATPITTASTKVSI